MAGSIKDQVAIIGVGCTKFGDNFDQSFEDLLVEAGFAAFADARIEPERVEAAWLGTFSPYAGNGKASVSLADALRLYGKPHPPVGELLRNRPGAIPQPGFGVSARH